MKSSLASASTCILLKESCLKYSSRPLMKRLICVEGQNLSWASLLAIFTPSFYPARRRSVWCLELHCLTGEIQLLVRGKLEIFTNLQKIVCPTFGKRRCYVVWGSAIPDEKHTMHGQFHCEGQFSSRGGDACDSEGEVSMLKYKKEMCPSSISTPVGVQSLLW